MIITSYVFLTTVRVFVIIPILRKGFMLHGPGLTGSELVTVPKYRGFNENTVGRNSLVVTVI